jgi:hypothetical protein
VTVLCVVRVHGAIRTEDVQERVLQAEELVAVGRHDGVMCWVVVLWLWLWYSRLVDGGTRTRNKSSFSTFYSTTPLL